MATAAGLSSFGSILLPLNPREAGNVAPLQAAYALKSPRSSIRRHESGVGGPCAWWFLDTRKEEQLVLLIGPPTVPQN
jgi:hypothetical protein